MGKYFEDYKWSSGRPVGIKELENAVAGKAYFKFIPQSEGVVVEQFDEQGRFIRLCHDPSDIEFKEEKFESLVNNTFKIRKRKDGSVAIYEKYTFLNEERGDNALVLAEIYNSQGRLIETHEDKRISDTAVDVYVRDVLGKLKVIIHHTETDKGEPYKIREEYIT